MFTHPSKFSSIQMPHRAKTSKPHDTGKQTATLFLLLLISLTVFFSQEIEIRNFNSQQDFSKQDNTLTLQCLHI